MDTSPIVLDTTGGTDLYGSCLDLLAELTSDTTRKEGSKVMIIVISDGHDMTGRVSTQAVASDVAIIEENMGWDFLFVGTDIDAYRVGEAMGVKPGKALSFANTSWGFEKMLISLNSIIRQWSAGQISHDSEFFTSDIMSEQEALMS